ncbi:hypothetical protein [Paenibacillus sp. IHBB 3054]
MSKTPERIEEIEGRRKAIGESPWQAVEQKGPLMRNLWPRHSRP